MGKNWTSDGGKPKSSKQLQCSKQNKDCVQQDDKVSIVLSFLKDHGLQR